MLPLRPRGVRNVIEFIVSIHPSTKPPVSSKGVAAETSGPSISLEALDSASKLISSPPSGMSPDAWFAGIAPQLLELLDGQGGLEMVKASSYIIGYGILGRREYGAPGSSGWMAFAAPMIGCIDLNYGHKYPLKPKIPSNSSNDDVIDLTIRNVLVSASELAEALRRLASLLSSHPNPGLSRRLLGNVLLPLWSIASWPANGTELEEWRAPATYLLQIILQLSDDSKFFAIANDLMFRGKRERDGVAWIHRPASPEGIQIETWLDEDGQFDRMSLEDLAIIDKKVDTFVTLLQPSRDEGLVAKLFLSFCKDWLLAENQSQPEIILSSVKKDNPDISTQQLTGGRIMQKMMTTMPELLVGDSTQVLELASEVLQRSINSREDLERDETIPIALSLLNLVFTSTHVRAAREAPFVSVVKDCLTRISRNTKSDISTTAQNILYLLEYQENEVVDTVAPTTDQRDEDRKTYKLAMSYLTSTESPPPVRAQGLDLLCDLIRSNSPVLDIPATLILLASLLQDEEEYIYLRCIKAYIQLSERQANTVIGSLVERYVDSNEEASLDARLRVGEALLQVIERSGKMFQGPVSQDVAAGLLSVAGRRGYKPKAEDAYRKREAASKNQKLEAEKAWDGPVPQLEEDQEEGYELLQQIVEGWGSKRGEEDVRIRASALAILGTAIEVNVAGLGSSITSSAVDLSINILALESEPEKAILRRAAILLIMSLIRALDQTNPGFGFAGQSLDDVLRILKYIETVDNDGLVRQHAKDVIEGLETWQMKSLLEASKPQARSSSLGDGLASLSLGATSGSERKPRIEEID